MKHCIFFISASATMALLLSACHTAHQSPSYTESDSASSTELRDSPVPVPSGVNSQNDVNEEIRETQPQSITFYSSVRDIPNVDIDYSDNRNGLTKDGQPWVSAPGTQQFGNLCFSDGKTLYIQCFISNDTDEFKWFYACFNHMDSDCFLPEETCNKLFDRADGYTLYSEDGFTYTIMPCTG